MLESLVAALVLAQAPAPAGDFMRWYCWLQSPTAVSCLLEQSPQALDASGLDEAALERLPPLVRALRTNPGEVRGRHITVPLLGPAFDAEGVAKLAGAVMCGSQRRCMVAFSEAPDAARIARILSHDHALATRVTE